MSRPIPDILRQAPMPASWLERDYHLFNDQPSFMPRKDKAFSFPAFSRLPIDLRLTIWELALDKPRFINIEIRDAKSRPDDSPIMYTRKNHLGNTISDAPYKLKIEGLGTTSSMLWVNHEASRVFLSHYRTRLPVDSRPRELLFNPEYDTIHVRFDLFNDLYNDASRSPPIQMASMLVPFIHDVKAYDPKGVGIAHLALSGKEITELANTRPADFPEIVKISMKDFLTHGLRSLRLMVQLGGEGRNMLGNMSWTNGEIHHNRSVPLSGDLLEHCIQNFSVLERDPRPIDLDLSHIARGFHDPRRIFWHWNKFALDFLGSEYKQKLEHVDVRYLLSLRPTLGPGSPQFRQERRDIVAVLRGVDWKWQDDMDKIKLPTWGTKITENQHKDLEIKKNKDTGEIEGLMSVAGFWLFPVEAFGSLDSLPMVGDEQVGFGLEPVQWKYKRVEDLSKYRPQLGVFHLK